MNTITLISSVLTLTLSLMSILILLIDRRRAITPSLDYDVQHEENHTVVVLQFGRLEKFVYSIESIATVGTPQAMIIGLTNLSCGKIEDLKPTNNAKIAISVHPSSFKQTETDNIVCKLTGINKTSALRIHYRTNYHPYKAFHEIKIYDTDYLFI